MYYIKNKKQMTRYCTSSHELAAKYYESVKEAEGYAELWIDNFRYICGMKVSGQPENN